MTQARNISLSRFSQLANIPKTSIYRRCTELGIDTSSGLSPDAVELLKADFGLVQDEPEPEPATVAHSEIVPSDFIQPGQLATVEAHDISLPDSFDTSAMVKFFDGVTGQATDTTKLVAIADLALNVTAIAPPYFLPAAGGYFSSNLTRTACSIRNAARLAVGRPS
ncbi:MAG: hypothetical protein Fur0046_22930 [Cyanobacteria bacterium J069]